MDDAIQQMSIAELNEAMKRQIVNTEILMRDVKDIKYTLIGNEMNNHNGLIKDFHDFKQEVRDINEEFDGRLRKTEDIQTGMKWGTRIIGFLLASGFVIQLVSGLKWIFRQLFQ